MFFRAARVPCVIALLLGAFLLVPAAHADSVGQVRFVKEADSAFDKVTEAPSAETADWMRSHFWRQRTYAPYFDARTSWYANAWTYRDAYAIYNHADAEVSIERHPDWVLRDANGGPLYIPFDCANGTCPQYAADIGNPAFRAQWIAGVRETLSQGRYHGLFIDDVNLEFSVSNGNEDHVDPIDPRTGQTMSAETWRRYMAEFMEQVRAELPGIEIVHNQVWFVGHDDPYVQRALLAADGQNLERGVVDGGIQGGDGKFGLQTFFDHVDWLHARGKGVVFDSSADTQDSAEYNLAAYFLTATMRDGFRADYRDVPGDWWSGYDVDLGQPRGQRYRWSGLWRRDFGRGFAIVNEPHEPAQTVALPDDAKGPDGVPLGSVTLSGASGRVVLTGKAGVPERPSGTRAAAPIVVQPVPNPRLAKRRPRLAKAALVRGTVRGTQRGRVVVSIQRKAGGHWRTVRHTRVQLRKARFARLFRQLPKGAYRVRAQHRQAKGRMAHSSRQFRVRR